MCGRYTVRATWHEMVSQFRATGEPVFPWTARYNIAPTQQVPIVRAHAATRELACVRWGLIPSWASDEKIGSRLINARSETLLEKPSFRTAFRRRRCLIVVDGFYEWRTQGRTKLPFYIQRRDQRLFAFAGLWEQWWGPSEQRRVEPLTTCTVITTDANAFMAPIHDRMPVIISPDDYELWLQTEGSDLDQVTQLLHPYLADDLQMYPVSTLVNRPTVDDADCIQPLAPSA